MNTSTGLISRLTSADGINYVNIGLMIISAVAAFVLPFELFLFVYAVLGPLHYLTEISWLDKKNFFVRAKSDIWIFVFFVLIITIGMFRENTSKFNAFLGSLLFSAFVYALVIMYVEKVVVKIGVLVVAFMISLIFSFNQYPNFPYLLFGMWLPTIIHVYVFTGAFVLYGALKTKSRSGMISLLVFIVCGIVCFIYIPEQSNPVSEYCRNAYHFFRFLNVTLYNFFSGGTLSPEGSDLYLLPKAVAVMRFIAFAYTYHYLNWFSKTSVIKWNQVSRQRLAIILTLWVLSMVLYFISYSVGFYALFLLSMLHVFFEFPLNHQTFIGIGKELRGLVRKN
ncbi:MAG: hypothetical protein ACJ77K_11195 [Bacteroidia bacterium]